MPEGNQTAGRFRLNRAAARVRYIFSHKQEEKTMSFMIETSARHIHLTQETVEKLFGKG